MKIYGISGLGADKRVFDSLNLILEIESLTWIPPEDKEDVGTYASRLCSRINEKEDFILLGVSFGGLVAIEISKILKPKLTILVSSIETADELKTLFSFFGKTKINHILPKQLFVPPKSIAYYLFGAKDKKMLSNILNDTDRYFAKWAVSAMLNWKNDQKITPILKINGGNDRMINGRVDENTVIIKDGAHFMIVDNSTEVSEIINKRIEEIIR